MKKKLLNHYFEHWSRRQVTYILIPALQIISFLTRNKWLKLTKSNFFISNIRNITVLPILQGWCEKYWRTGYIPEVKCLWLSISTLGYLGLWHPLWKQSLMITTSPICHSFFHSFNTHLSYGSYRPGLGSSHTHGKGDSYQNRTTVWELPQVLGRTSPSLWKYSKSWGSVSIYIWSGRVSYFAFLFQSLTIHSSFLIGSSFEKFTLSPKGQGADSTYANWVLLPRHVKPVHSDRDFKCMNLLIIAMAPDPALPAMRLFQSLPFVLLRSCLSSPSKPGCQPALWVSDSLLLNFIFTLVSQSSLWQQQNII